MRWYWLALVLLLACKASKGEQCQGSADCSDGLSCLSSTCVEPATYCRETPGLGERCTLDGSCTLDGDNCVAGSEQDCKESTRCKEHGHCTFADKCCSLAGVCPSVEEDPFTHVARLGDASKRHAAIDKIASLYESALLQDGGDPKGEHVKPLLDIVVLPLAGIAERQKLPVDRQAKVLTLLASSRHPKAASALLEVLRLYRVDGNQPTPIDAAMSDVLVAVTDMKLMDAASSVFPLFTNLQASWRKAEVRGLSRSLERAVMVLADDSWEAKLIEMIGEPLDSRGDIRALRNQLYWQRGAARALGQLRSDKAVVPLMKVVLSPLKADVRQAAIGALVAIGKPAVEVAAAVIKGEHEALEKFASDVHAAAVTTDVGDVVDRSAEAVRIEAAAVVLASIGRSGAEVVAAIDKVDEIGKARIAMALHGLPSDPKLIETFKTAYDTAPLDLPIDKRHRGVAAIMHQAPFFFDASLTPWITKGAIEMEGSDTAIAPFREAALEAALWLMTHEQAANIEELGALITREKWEQDFQVAKQLVAKCSNKASCYLATLTPSSKDFARRKAAHMVAMYASEGDREAIIKALTVERDVAVRPILALAIDRATPKGDAKLADDLEDMLGGETLADPKVSLLIGRLRARVSSN